jgi:WD40 repeat protein
LLWDPTTEEPPTTLGEFSAPVSALDFCLDGSRLASGGSEGRVCVWDLRK